jgi:DNA-binding MarR family transcriptional regulator
MVSARNDLHWLALQLYRNLGTLELPAVRAQGLSLWGYEVLTRLVGEPAQSQLELAEALGLDKSKVVRVMDELEANGHATREPGPDDRRRRTIAITPRGRRAWRATSTALAKIEANLFTQLPPRQRDTTRAGIQRLVAALDEMLSDASGSSKISTHPFV